MGTAGRFERLRFKGLFRVLFSAFFLGDCSGPWMPKPSCSCCDSRALRLWGGVPLTELHVESYLQVRLERLGRPLRGGEGGGDAAGNSAGASLWGFQVEGLLIAAVQHSEGPAGIGGSLAFGVRICANRASMEVLSGGRSPCSTTGPSRHQKSWG